MFFPHASSPPPLRGSNSDADSGAERDRGIDASALSEPLVVTEPTAMSELSDLAGRLRELSPPAAPVDEPLVGVGGSPAKTVREPLARPGCVLTAVASAVGAVVGAVVTGVFLLLVLSGGDANRTSGSVSASPDVVSAASAPNGTAPSPASSDVAASGAEQAESADQSTGRDAESSDGGSSDGESLDGESSEAESSEAEITDAGSSDATSAPILDGTISDELLRSELERLLTAANGTPAPVADVDGAESESEALNSDFAYWDRLLSGETGEPGAPLGNRLQQINVKAVLEAVQESVVIVRITTADGDGGGSGFVVTSQGRIVTNAHVVADAETIEVRFFGGSQMPAEVIAIDPTRDLAVLQVEAEGLPAVKLGSSDGVEVGDEVIAIGNAIGIIGEPTVTSGIVSGLERSIELEDDTRLVRLIQTDAAINPGNSGGPLVNAAGEVIGVNTAIAGGLVEGIGFAISIDHARPIIDQLLEGVVQAKAYLGVRIIAVEDFLPADDDPSEDPTDDPTEGLGDSGPEAVEPGPDPADEFADIKVPAGITQGAIVIGVEEGEAADLAGIRRGEIIVKFSGIEITNSLDLVNEILALVPGDSAELEIVSPDGSRRTINVKLGSFEAATS